MMSKKDWLFRDDDSVCGFRAAGVLIHEGRLLVQRERDGSIYALPGGHVGFGETAAQALVREYREEAGLDVACGRLIWVEECFWQWGNRPAHYINFYHLIEAAEGLVLPAGASFVQQDNPDVVMEWVILEELHGLTVYPAFLKEQIMRISGDVKHFVSRD